MLIRLALSLLIACLALPAMAAPRCDTPPVASAGKAAHHGSHQDQPAAPSPPVAHDCIGCIAPIARDIYRPEQEPFHAPARSRPTINTDNRAHFPGAPEPPPPRHPA